MEKVCFKSDGTAATGRKIIITLEKLGGKNNDELACHLDYTYYYIDNGEIRCNKEIPDGYRLASLDEFDKPAKTFPREMMVSDSGRAWYKRIVLYKNDNCCVGVHNNYNDEFKQGLLFSTLTYKMCKELDEVSTEKQQLEKELTELKAKVAEMEETVKKMK